MFHPFRAFQMNFEKIRGKEKSFFFSQWFHVPKNNGYKGKLNLRSHQYGNEQLVFKIESFWNSWACPLKKQSIQKLQVESNFKCDSKLHPLHPKIFTRISIRKTCPSVLSPNISSTALNRMTSKPSRRYRNRFFDDFKSSNTVPHEIVTIETFFWKV